MYIVGRKLKLKNQDLSDSTYEYTQFIHKQTHLTHTHAHNNTYTHKNATTHKHRGMGVIGVMGGGLINTLKPTHWNPFFKVTLTCLKYKETTTEHTLIIILSF